jgi:hypothetical protein
MFFNQTLIKQFAIIIVVVLPVVVGLKWIIIICGWFSLVFSCHGVNFKGSGCHGSSSSSSGYFRWRVVRV